METAAPTKFGKNDRRYDHTKLRPSIVLLTFQFAFRKPLVINLNRAKSCRIVGVGGGTKATF